MSDDLTDALRRIIEPMKDELVSAAQRHYLASIQMELADSHRHTERALELISDLITEDTEPHWNIQSGTPNLMMWAREMVRKSPPPDEPPGGYSKMEEAIATIRQMPRIGDTWLFDYNGRAITGVILEDGCTDGIPEIARDSASGQVFKFNSVRDPIPLRRMDLKTEPGETPDPYPEPEPGSAQARMEEGTDTF